MFCVLIYCTFNQYFVIALNYILDKYDTYKINYFEHTTEFLNNFNLRKNDNTKALNEMCTNIRSVNANFDELLLENDLKYRDIYILILTETWHKFGVSMCSIFNYKT